MKHYLPPALKDRRIIACIGLISDTHMPQRWPALPPALFRIFRGVDLLLHAGDVGELWVLDQLSTIAPVIAVHGNDDSIEAQDELPFQQLLTIAGLRFLLWHSHYPDKNEEMASRQGDEIRPKLNRSLDRARRSGANVVVFGHWHIPLVYQHDGILVVNPGAIASSNAITRQLRQTVALLFISKEGHIAVTHIDLSTPKQPYTPAIDWNGGFQRALDQFSTSILSPELAVDFNRLRQSVLPLAPEQLTDALLRVAHRCWSGERAVITYADLLAEVRQAPDISPDMKQQIEAAVNGVTPH